MSFFLLLLTVFVIYFQPAHVFPWIAQYRPFRTIVLLSLLFFIFAGTKPVKSFFSVAENKFFLLFVLMQILSSTSIWISGGIATAMWWLSMVIVYFLLYSQATSVKRIKLISIAIIMGIAYLSYYSLSIYSDAYFPGYRAKGFGWFDGANDLGLALVAAIPFCFLISELVSGLIRIIVLMLPLMFIVNIMLTGSRNILLGLAVVGGLCLFFSQKIQKPLKLILFSGMIMAIIAVGIKVVLSRADLQNSLSGDNSSEHRILQWKAGVRMALKNPIFGIGPGEFASEAGGYDGVRGLGPHNTIVQAFAETGIPGGIFFLLFSVWPLIKSYTIIRQQMKFLKRPWPEEFIVFCYLNVCLVGVWTCAFFSTRIQGYMLYTVVALLVATREYLLLAPNKH